MTDRIREVIYDLPLQQFDAACPWPIRSIADAATVLGGGTPDTEVAELWNPPEIPWATPTDITGTEGNEIHSTDRHISQAGLKQSTLVPADSILMTSRATIGAAKINRVPMAINQGFAALCPKEGYSTDYLFHLLDVLRPTLLRLGAGTTFLEASRREIRKVRAQLPDEDEQRSIAAALKLADDAIAKARAQLEATRQFQLSLMSQLFMQGIQLWARPTQGTKLGRIPVDWSVTEIRSLWTGSTNGLYVPEDQYGSGIPIVRIDTFSDGFFDTHDFKRIRVKPDEVEAFSLAPGDVLINRVNSIPFLGKVVFVDHIDEFTVFESNMMRLRFASAELAQYMSLYLSVPAVKKRIWAMGRPAVAQLSINQRDVGKFLVALPGREERKAILDAVAAAKQSTFSASKNLQALNAVKRSLLHNLLTGKLRLP